MKKKEDVVIFFDSRRELNDIKKEILSFGKVSFDVVKKPQGIRGFIYFNKKSGNILKESVSIQELKNILAAEYLKPGDEVAIIERLHDTLHENHGYSLDSELLTNARKLALKLKK